ncbi:CYTH and CHAD domain-containing protein [Cellulomonas marina]|uniref:CHAD domain-containing protein n=1 Tax=Cellulomonas marina TaxID=988821 RepID=A0A1I1AP15_9CELL|nr:CYTH and CHAD domain-containing protein [Cellulomonas marina]GIG30442.1 CHAD domain-containing protein [Cellulomonas marina]SFB39146.1 CHAD domain-containing protein [Cellulomonas marina]
MTDGVQTERERTYDVGHGGDLPDLAALAAEAVPDLPERLREVVTGARVETDRYALRTVYLDTEDLRLATAGITLRRREGGADDGWHVKLPASTGASRDSSSRGGGDGNEQTRTEVHRPLTDDEDPPAELLRLVRARTGTAPVRPVVRLAVDRHVRRLVAADGTVLVELADDRVAAVRGGAEPGDADEPRAWREAELELVDGDPALADALDVRLRAAGLLPAAQPSKLARALDLRPLRRRADGGPGQRRDGVERDRPRRLRRRSPAGDVLVAHLAEQLETLRGHDPYVRLGAPGAVHDARVAVRRLRSALRTHRRLLRDDAVAGLQDELAWLGDALGGARDAEVLRERFGRVEPDASGGGQDADAPALAALDAALAQETADARAALAEALDDDRYRALLDRLDALVAEPPLRGRARRRADRALPPLVEAEIGRTMARLDRARRAAPGDARDDALHAARRAAKRLRYAAEAGAPALGAPGRRVARRAHALQRVLGDQHDAVVARQRLAALASRSRTPRGTAFALGRLHAEEGHRAAAAEAAVEPARRALRRLRGTMG